MDRPFCVAPTSPARRLVALALLCAGPLLAAEWVDEPLDGRAGRWWLAASPELQVDPWRAVLRPTRPGHPATVEFGFSIHDDPGAIPHLSVAWRARLDQPGDSLQWEARRDGGAWQPVPLADYAGGDGRLDLTPLLAGARRLDVRLTLTAAERPERVRLERLAWNLAAVERVQPDQPRLTPGAWLYPAWQALTHRRVAPPIPPGPPPAPGGGRVVLPIEGHFGSTPRSMTESGWSLGASEPGRTRLLVVPVADAGGSLKLDGRVVAEHRLPGMPVGVELPSEGVASQRVWQDGGLELFDRPGDGYVPALELPYWIAPFDAYSLRSATSFAPDGVVLSVGPLELRYVAVEQDWRGEDLRLGATAVVINRTTSSRAATIRARLVDPLGREVATAVTGRSLPPGAWLAPLSLAVADPMRWTTDNADVYRLTVSVECDAAASDASTRLLGLKRVESAGDGLRLNGRELERVEPAARPADAAASGARRFLWPVHTWPSGPKSATIRPGSVYRRGPVSVVSPYCPAPTVLVAAGESEALALRLMYGAEPSVLAVVVDDGSE